MVSGSHTWMAVRVSKTQAHAHTLGICAPLGFLPHSLSLFSPLTHSLGGGGVSVPFSGETPLNRTALVNAPESVARLYRTVGSKPPTWGGAGCAYGCEMDL